MNKTFHIKVFGCQMNVYDSQRIVDMLTGMGMSQTDDELAADIILLHTCYIRKKASDKIFSELGRLYKFYLRKKKTPPVFAVSGCVAKAEGENIFKRAPFVSIVLSSQKYHLLPELLEQAVRPTLDDEKPFRFIDTDLTGLEKFDTLPRLSKSDKVAFVQIQEGCDNFCTYCVVPNTRGREVSRSVQDVIAEITHLVSLGVLEINLLGQNVDCYNGVGVDGAPSTLSALIREVAKFEEVKRIRYTTSYPSKIDDGMVAVHKELPQVMPLVYLPIQAGSDKILKAMNRKYTAATYLEIIEKLKLLNPRIQISSDFIVGFPGESDEDFEETMKVVEKVGFVQCYAFKYSPRPNTPAAKMENQVDESVKASRLRRLQLALRASQDRFNKSCVGSVMSVLVESVSKTDSDYLIGKNEYLQPVILKGSAELIGKIVDVKISQASYANLKAELLLNQ